MLKNILANRRARTLIAMDLVVIVVLIAIALNTTGFVSGLSATSAGLVVLLLSAGLVRARKSGML